MTIQSGFFPLDAELVQAGTVAVNTGSAASSKVICPFNGLWIATYANIDVVMDADTDLDAFVNDADSGIVFTLLDTQVIDTGHYIGPSAELGVRAGDLLEVRSDGAQTAATTGYLAFLIRRG